MTDVPVSPTDVEAVADGDFQDAAHRVHRRTVAVAVAPEPEPTYIGLITRAIAFAIDAAVINLIAVLVAAAAALIISVLPVGHDFKTFAAAVGGVVYLIWTVSYFAVFWSTTGQTPGNRVMEIRVVDAEGDEFGFFRGIVRFAGVCLAVLPLLLGLVPILFNERRRGLQDAIANTVVIDASEPAEAASPAGADPRGRPGTAA